MSTARSRLGSRNDFKHRKETKVPSQVQPVERLVPIASAVRAISAAERFAVPSSIMETASWARPARDEGGRLPPPFMATVMASVGSSRWGRTQTGMPLPILRISGRGARNTTGAALGGGFLRSSGGCVVLGFRPRTDSVTLGLSSRYLAATLAMSVAETRRNRSRSAVIRPGSPRKTL